jgi:hypothetical protein
MDVIMISLRELKWDGSAESRRELPDAPALTWWSVAPHDVGCAGIAA